MSGRDAVTVVMPTHNRQRMLARTLSAVLAEEAVQLRVIVVDDASTDGTAAWLARQGDPRVEVIRRDRPGGPAAARNDGAAGATTQWIAFCDDDDLWAPAKLAAQLTELRRRPDARWSCTGTVSIDESLAIVGYQRPYLGNDLPGALRVANVIPAGASGVLVERELLEDVGGWDETLDACEDFDLWCRLAQCAELAPVDAPLVGYRVWTGSRSGDPDLMRTWQDRVIARYCIDDPAETDRSELLRDQYLGRFLLRRQRRWPAARHFYRMALRHRLWTHAVHGTVALTCPRLALQWADYRERSRVPSAWRAQAETWLAPYRRDLVSA